GEGPSGGPATFAGLALAHERGERAPQAPGASRRADAPAAGVPSGSGAPSGAGTPSAHDAPQSTAPSDPHHPTAPGGGEASGGSAGTGTKSTGSSAERSRKEDES
ncbi:MAG: hypothetical protein ACRDYU_12215, partial [Actinomycetes bacterium]